MINIHKISDIPTVEIGEKRLLPSDFALERYGINVRLVNETDAEFIVALRTDEKLGKHIHATSPDIEAQRQWIKNYQVREANNEDFYFMFEKPQHRKLGVCRIYDIKANSFTTGSWVFSSQSPVGAAILADIITREIAYELFPDRIMLFDVKRTNVTVNRYHESFHSELLSQDEDTNYYTCSIENFERCKKNHLRMFFR